MKWVFWKKHQGVRHMGGKKYKPTNLEDNWQKIMGVIASCEGNHDTVVSYDGTGITWGFMQWTFTSGRLQRLLQYMDRKPWHDGKSVFWWVFVRPYLGNIDGSGQVFKKFGFVIKDGRFWDLHTSPPTPLNPNIHKKRINDICMGLGKHYNPAFGSRRQQARELALVFAKAGAISKVAEVQVDFAIHEFMTSLNVKRRPLGKVKTIANLLEGTWETPLPALFFNLWQNSPKYAYKLFLKNYRKGESAEVYFSRCWNHLMRSKFGNWSYAKPKNKSPRIRRIQKAIMKYYDICLPVR